ncbi:MAG TPA: hypothetical protein DCY13_18595 [Verrucomicrobiales bacterium]|nr:hypothetical protein [Verrucomicrobiales bacterium]
MAFLNLRPDTSLPIRRLPTGSMTVDSRGSIVTSTVPTSFPASQVEKIAKLVVRIFQRGHEVGHPFGELIIQFAAYKITARELRGGAIVFLAAQKRTS